MKDTIKNEYLVLALSLKKYTIEEIAKLLGLTIEKVRYTKRKALLRTKLLLEKNKSY